jgi:hypothetical protein
MDGLLNKATTADENPTPGYVYPELVKLTHADVANCDKMADWLYRRLTRSEPSVKYKVLQVMKLRGQLSLRGLFGELLAPGCASALSAGADSGRLFASLAEYAEDKAVQNMAVAAALEASGVGGSPGRVQVWQAVFSTEYFAPLLDCITAATNWPAKQVPKKIDALYTHLNNIAHSGFPAVAAQLTDSYLEIPAGAVTGPDTELAVCMASFFGVKYKRVGGWQGGGSLPAEE